MSVRLLLFFLPMAVDVRRTEKYNNLDQWKMRTVLNLNRYYYNGPIPIRNMMSSSSL